ALDLRLDGVRRIDPRDLHRHVELELDVRHPGLHHRPIVGRVDLLQIAHALDAGGEQASVAQRVEHRCTRRRDGELSAELHGAAIMPPSAPAASRAAGVPPMRGVAPNRLPRAVPWYRDKPENPFRFSGLKVFCGGNPPPAHALEWTGERMEEAMKKLLFAAAATVALVATTPALA